MIEIDLKTAFVLYLTLFLAICLIAWATTFFKQRRKKPSLKLEQLTTCEYCHHSFLAPTDKQLARCPECDCLVRQTVLKSL